MLRPRRPSTPAATPVISPSSQAFTGTLSSSSPTARPAPPSFTQRTAQPHHRLDSVRRAPSLSLTQTIKPLHCHRLHAKCRRQQTTLFNPSCSIQLSPLPACLRIHASVSFPSPTTGAKIYFTTTARRLRPRRHHATLLNSHLRRRLRNH